MDACLVMVVLLPAHDNKNGTRRIHGSNKWDHETPPLSICELLIHQWWEGRKRSATAGRDNSRKHDANSTHGNNDDESNNENEQKERQDFADDGKSGKKWQSKSTGTLALASSALCSPPLPLPPNLVERHPCCRHRSPAPRGPWAALFSPHLGSCQLMAALPSWHTDDDDTTCVPCVRVNAPHPRTKPNVEGTSPWCDFMGWEGRNRRPGTGANGKKS